MQYPPQALSPRGVGAGTMSPPTASTRVPPLALSAQHQRRPSQRQMLDLAFEGKMDGQAVDDELHAELILSPRSPRGDYDYDNRRTLSPRGGTAAAAAYQPLLQRPSMGDALLSPRASGGLERGSSGLGASAAMAAASTYLLNTSVGSDDSAMMEAADPELFQAGVFEHARRLGIDPDAEAELLWIARESLVAPLPEGWHHATATETGEPYYYNELTGESRWDHPCDEQFRQMAHDLKHRQSAQRFSSGEMHTASYYDYNATAGGGSGGGGAGGALAWAEDPNADAGGAYTAYHHQQHQQHTGGAWAHHPYESGANDDYSGHYAVEGYAQTANNGYPQDDAAGAEYDADTQSTEIHPGRPQRITNGIDSPSRRELEQLQKRLSDSEERVRALEAQKTADEDLMLSLQGEIDELKQQKAENSPTNNHADMLAQLEATVEELRAKLLVAEKKSEDMELENGSLRQELESYRAAQQASSSADAQATTELEALREAVTKEQSLRSQVEEALRVAREQLQLTTNETNSAKATIKRLESDLSRHERRVQKDHETAVATAASASTALATAEARIADLSQQLSLKEQEAESNSSELIAVQQSIEALKCENAKTIETLKAEHKEALLNRDKMTETLKRELTSLKEELRSRADENAKLVRTRDEEAKVSAARVADAEEQQRALKRDIRALEREIKGLQTISKEREEELAATKRVMESLEVKLKEQDNVVAAARKAAFEEAELAAAESIRQAQAEKARVAELYAQELQTRRKLHNRLMELQGNIRVFCRVRPIQAVELKSEQSATAVFFRENDPEGLDLVVGGDLGPDGKLVGAGQKHQFEFDHVFQPSSTQEQVFEQTRALVTSALDGFNVCIFAYGQTGSGKTHTMEGPDSDRGVNFRSLEELFRIRADRAATGNFECTMKLSILEVYNETIVDLLDTAPPPGNGVERKGLEIRMGKQGVYVENLMEVEVFNEKDVTELMKLGKSHRSVGSHDFNEHSSRSHLVLSITIETLHRAENRRRCSKLHLIDLAGSERVSKTAASGQRLKEAQNINRSLSALGDVIAALGASSKHVPYRNSKLTFLLQESLSGNSKVLMFVNVSPVQWNAWETLCSLNFAARCRNVALGLAKANAGPAPTSGGGGTASSPSSGPKDLSGDRTRMAPALSVNGGVGNAAGLPRGTPASVTKGAQRVVFG